MLNQFHLARRLRLVSLVVDDARIWCECGVRRPSLNPHIMGEDKDSSRDKVCCVKTSGEEERSTKGGIKTQHRERDRRGTRLTCDSVGAVSSSLSGAAPREAPGRFSPLPIPRLLAKFSSRFALRISTCCSSRRRRSSSGLKVFFALKFVRRCSGINLSAMAKRSGGCPTANNGGEAAACQRDAGAAVETAEASPAV